MVIDAHHHLGQEADYADKLIDTMAKLGVDKTVLLATGTSGPGSSNEEIEKAIKKHADKLIGFGWVDPALDPNAVDTVQQLYDQGFRGLKFIKTRKAYDDRSYIPTYQKAADLEMPILFHQGIVARHADDIANDVHSGRMMPVHLDYIARQVPELVMIGAHLGNPWWYEGGMVLRWNPNLYMDITGSTLKMLAPEDVGKILWWRRDSQYPRSLGSRRLGKNRFRHRRALLPDGRRDERLPQLHGRARRAARHPAGVWGGAIRWRKS